MLPVLPISSAGLVVEKENSAKLPVYVDCADDRTAIQNMLFTCTWEWNLSSSKMTVKLSR